MSVVEDIQQAAEKVKAGGKSKPRAGRHPVNQPMVDHWLDAMGDKNPIYVDEAAAKAAGHPGMVTPPAMIQVWTMAGLGGERAPDDPLTKILGLFDGAGYIGVVATNCEQIYHRYLRPGEEVSITAELTDVVAPEDRRAAVGGFLHHPECSGVWSPAIRYGSACCGDTGMARSKSGVRCGGSDDVDGPRSPPNPAVTARARLIEPTARCLRLHRLDRCKLPLVLVGVANFAAIRCACFRTSTVAEFSIS